MTNGDRDEVHRDLRRELVGDADREIHDDRINDEGTPMRSATKNAAAGLVGDVDQRRRARETARRAGWRCRNRSARAGVRRAGPAANISAVAVESEEGRERRRLLVVLHDGARDGAEADRLRHRHRMNCSAMKRRRATKPMRSPVARFGEETRQRGSPGEPSPSTGQPRRSSIGVIASDGGERDVEPDAQRHLRWLENPGAIIRQPPTRQKIANTARIVSGVIAVTKWCRAN